MLTKEEIVHKATEIGFGDIGFTTVEPFDSQRAMLKERYQDYDWVERLGLSLTRGSDPKSIMPEGKTIIVLIFVYFHKGYPNYLEGHFGRCYLDDDRITKDGLAVQIKAFREFLTENGIASKMAPALPHRLAAARAGLGTFGKNNLFYSRMAARQSSFVLPIALIVDRFFEPDLPTIQMGCPDWCRNVCIAACPTRALKGPGRIDPRKCISYLTYYGEGLTPVELREPMGLYVYGCDRCQNVCPRNAARLAEPLPMNDKVVAKAPDFQLERLLHMDKAYFKQKIWPNMFYMAADDIWRWQMNAARAMGNTRDDQYVDDLATACRNNPDERVQAMAAWALGHIGGKRARVALEGSRRHAGGVVLQEIDAALAKGSRKNNFTFYPSRLQATLARSSGSTSSK